MGPRRKKSKPNDKAPAASTPLDNSNGTNPPSNGDYGSLTASDRSKTSAVSTDSLPSSELTRQESGSRTNNDRDGTATRKSWYGGSWKTKAPALTEIAKDGFAAASKSSLSLAKEPSKDKDSSESPAARYMEKRLGTPRRSVASIATENPQNARSSPEKAEGTEVETQSNGIKDAEPEAPLPPDPFPKAVLAEDDKKNTIEASLKESNEKGRPSSGWFGWWSRPDGYGSDMDKAADTSKANAAVIAEARTTPLPDSPVEERNVNSKATVLNGDKATDGLISSQSNEDGHKPQTRQPGSGATSDGNVPGSTRSWFGLWSKAENQRASPPPNDGNTLDTSSQPSPIDPPDKPGANDEKPRENEVESPQVNAKSTPKSTAWAFWSKDKPKDEGKATPGGTQKQVGEIAVADTPSQSHPEAAQYNEQKQASLDEPNLKTKDRKRKIQASSLESAKSTPAPSPPLKPSSSSKSTDQLLESTSKASSVNTPTTPKAASAKLDKATQKRQREERAATVPNLLLPTLRGTYPIYQAPSYWDQIRRLIFTGSYRDPNAPRHVDLLPIKEVPKIKKALAIGIHGFFPAQFLQMILGQPTGTSIRFANAAATAIKRWAEDHQPSDASSLASGGAGISRRDSVKTLRSQSSDIEIEKVALEGEGMVADRVDALWKLLLNWLPSIRKADFIVVAAHSQGVPVALQLLAKLLQFGCVREEVRVGVCAMAGINMGPFAELKSRFLAGSAVELFDFALRDSRVRQDYEAALELCLSKGVRISFVGSLDDQLVSLEVSVSLSCSEFCSFCVRFPTTLCHNKLIFSQVLHLYPHYPSPDSPRRLHQFRPAYFRLRSPPRRLRPQTS